MSLPQINPTAAVIKELHARFNAAASIAKRDKGSGLIISECFAIIDKVCVSKKEAIILTSTLVYMDLHNESRH
jgi:hypothetical protein